MRKTLFVGLLSLCILFGTAAYGANLEMDTHTASQGDTVIFTVSVNNAPNQVAAFGFDINFDSTVLEYKSHEKGALVQSGFSLFDANEISAGQLRIGGVDFGASPIQQGGTGILVRLTFLVLQNKSCEVQLLDLKDDFKTWSTKNGQFEKIPDSEPENHKPLANPLTISCSEGKTADIVLSGTDPDGDSLTYLLVSDPSYGTLQGYLPNLSYTPDENYSGTDSFFYKVSDGQADSDPAEVFIRIDEISPELSVNVSEKFLSLSWTPVSGAVGYYLYYAPFPEMAPISFIDMEDQTSLSGTLAPGAAYYVAIQAYDENGALGLSELKTFMIPPVLPAPQLTVSTEKNTVSLSWSEVEGAEGYILCYAPYPTVSPISSADLGNVTALSGELAPGAAFYLVVQAYDSEGRGGFSNVEYFILPED
ncbi:MAG: Ig-like domain-containing protein [Desulfobacterales bacterium]